MIKNQTDILKWIARSLGIIAILIYLALFLKYRGYIFSEPTIFNRYQNLSLFGIVTVGFIFAWFRAKEGGIIMTFGSIIAGLYIFYANTSTNGMLGLLIAISFAVPGVLFLIYDYKTKLKNE